MTLHVKLAVAIAGLLLFAYGARADDTRLRWAGIVFLAAAALLRFWRRRPPPAMPPPPPSGPPDA